MRITPRSKSLLLIAIFTTSLMIIHNPVPTQAYDLCDPGIESGDVAFVEYKGTIQSTGEVFDETGSGDPARFTVAEGQVIQGFYEGLLGMKIGEKKIIEVPPSKGYTDPQRAPTTDEGTTLYGKTLVFDVYIADVSDDSIKECDQGGSGGFASFLWKFLGWTAGAAILGFLGITGYFSLQKTTTPKCEHCKTQGRTDRLSEGKCGKCGSYYCRQSFSRGCPNCGSNTFVPNK